jgi:hypothetical protein
MFEYIIEKIKDAQIIESPFPHLDIKNFLSDEHLKIIMSDNQIHFNICSDDDDLYNKLINNDWKIQHFPGCVNDWNKYKTFVYKKYKSTNPVENVGITFRLKTYKNIIINKLIIFMNSDIFHNTLRNKFNIDKNTTILSAIQKNLSGYEISPHPDVRQKCLTYLLNINNNIHIEKEDCHTHLLEFKKEYKYISDLWEKDKNINRCWVPWDWCNTIKTMNQNNSMLIFKPDNNPPTLHAIKLKYNHLKYQRTQIYGNLMYKDNIDCKDNTYKDLIKNVDKN